MFPSGSFDPVMGRRVYGKIGHYSSGTFTNPSFFKRVLLQNKNTFINENREFTVE